MTETYAKLPVSKATFNEILKTLIDAGYEGDHFEKDFIDMDGFRLVRQEETTPEPRWYCKKCGTGFCGIEVNPVADDSKFAIQINCKHKVFSKGSDPLWHCSKCGKQGCDNFHWATSLIQQKCALE